MKYPKEQYNELKEGLKKLQPYFELNECNVHALHFMVYQQYNEGQQHNAFYIKGNELKKAHSLENKEGWDKLISSDFDFLLYPEGCHDSHIATAMRNAVKEVTA